MASNDDQQNKPHTYIVFGATGGMGSAVTRRLHEQGQRVVAAGRNGDKLSFLEQEYDARVLQIDACESEDVRRCFEAASEWSDRVDGVVNCVGSLVLKPAHLTKVDEFEQTLRTNVMSAFHVTQHAAQAMRKAGGSVVFVSSAAARLGLANHEAIAAAKGAVIGLARSAAATYAASNIRFNVVAPGLTRTPMTERITENEKALDTSLALHPLGRVGEPDDVAATIAWLLGPETGWMTGQVIGIDGGLADLKTHARR